MSRRKSQLGVKLTGGLEEEMTPWAGASLLIELGRQCGVTETADRVLPQKKSAKGLKPWQMMESFVVLSALGGECPEDMGRLRGDQGLEAMLGYHPPAAETARQWLDGFRGEPVEP